MCAVFVSDVLAAMSCLSALFTFSLSSFYQVATPNVFIISDWANQWHSSTKQDYISDWWFHCSLCFQHRRHGCQHHWQWSKSGPPSTLLSWEVELIKHLNSSGQQQDQKDWRVLISWRLKTWLVLILTDIGLALNNLSWTCLQKLQTWLDTCFEKTWDLTWTYFWLT